jgi:hypothetical protein
MKKMAQNGAPTGCPFWHVKLTLLFVDPVTMNRYGFRCY